MIDIQSIKSKLNGDNIIILMDSLGADFNYQSQGQIHFKSICHNSNSYKLYYFIDTKSFYCFREGKAFDAISLVQHVKHFDFNQSVSYICSALHLNAEEIKQNDDVDDWQSMKRYLPDSDIEQIEQLKSYDKSVLSLFNHLYPQDWLEYGITADTMDKFGVGWYARQACISIPVVFNGQLVGVRGRYTREQDVVRGKYRPITILDGQTLKFPTASCFYGYDQNRNNIEKSKKVILFESEKSVLKAPQYGIDNSLAVFGSNISKRHIQLLLELGINEVILGFDSDYHVVGDDDFKFFITKMKKLIGKLTPYFSVSIIYNNQGYDGYKYSPMDFTQEQFDKLWSSRVRIS